MGSVLLKILNAGGIGGAINELINTVISFTGGKIPEKAVLIAGLVLAVFIGILGYKYIKLLSTAFFAVAGYIIGSAGFGVIKGHFGWNIPNVVSYLVGVALLILLAYVAYKKFAYALCIIAGGIGFLAGYFIYPRYLVAAAVAVVVAMLAMCFVRYGFTAILSVTAGFLFMGMISAMVPDVRLLSLTEGFVGKLIAIVLSLIFVAIQLHMSHVEIKKLRGPRRVKIRRVFDTW